MKIAFVLWHTREVADYGDDAKLIGVYSSEEAALAAKQRSALLPGFRDNPDGFLIDRYEVDKDNWSEGFVIEYLSEYWATVKRVALANHNPSNHNK